MRHSGQRPLQAGRRGRSRAIDLPSCRRAPSCATTLWHPDRGRPPFEGLKSHVPASRSKSSHWADLNSPGRGNNRADNWSAAIVVGSPPYLSMARSNCANCSGDSGAGWCFSFSGRRARRPRPLAGFAVARLVTMAYSKTWEHTSFTLCAVGTLPARSRPRRAFRRRSESISAMGSVPRWGKM